MTALQRPDPAARRNSGYNRTMMPSLIDLMNRAMEENSIRNAKLAPLVIPRWLFDRWYPNGVAWPNRVRNRRVRCRCRAKKTYYKRAMKVGWRTSANGIEYLSPNT